MDGPYAKLSPSERGTRIHNIMGECLGDLVLGYTTLPALDMLSGGDPQVLHAIKVRPADPSFELAQTLLHEVDGVLRIAHELQSTLMGNESDYPQAFISALAKTAVLHRYGINPDNLTAFQQNWMHLDSSAQLAITCTPLMNHRIMNEFIDETITTKKPGARWETSSALKFEGLKQYFETQDIDWVALEGCHSKDVYQYIKKREMQRAGLITENVLPVLNENVGPTIG